MYSSYYSHNCNSHGAREHLCESMECRGGWSASRLGVPDPILALKSPQTTVVSWGWMVSRTVSTYVVACACSILRLVSDVAGGMYTLITLIRSLFGSIILVCKLYSLPDDVSILRGLRTYVASPPRVLSRRRCSTIV
jgi:hypothetical protein